MRKSFYWYMIMSFIIALLFISCSEENQKQHEIKYPNNQIKETGLLVKNEKGEFQREGEWKFFYDNGQLMKKSTYIKGKLNGSHEVMFKNGQKKEIGSYVGNEKDGKWSKWNEAGKLLEEITYRKGHKNGSYAIYTPEGKKIVQGEYQIDKKNGTWMKWFPNGKQKEKGSYLNGRKHGHWYHWDENGKLTDNLNYVKGQISNKKSYDRNNSTDSQKPMKMR